ncbi:SURF1 family protein [Calidifontibacter indicus]|uniref:SURF1 family protein n=1 Tax=Calidifontibacter indicus TaxID=419650 RepID=UPI003D73D140
MLRRLFTPRWIALLVVLVVAMAAMGVAGLWQLNVAKDRGVNQEVAKAPTKPVVPITTLIKPHQEFPGVESSRRVTATGTYEPDKQFLVADRRLDGKTGYWVVTPMIEQSTGARLVILRGFVTDPAQATKPTATRVSVVGSLAPGESPSTGTYPAGQLGSIDLSRLLNEWDGDLYNAFLFAISEQPNATDHSITRVPPPPPNPGHGFRFVNLMYAFQWWAFAIFAAYVFWRMLRDEVYGPPARRGTVRPTDNGSTAPSEETHV